MTSAPPSSLIPERPETFRRSTRCLGWARRSFMAGSRLWPPASSLASSLWRPSRSSASLTVPGVWYSNWAGYMSASPLLPGFGGLGSLPDPLGRQRHGIDVVHAEPRQGVHHRVDHRGRRRDRARLARALDAERVHGGRRLGAVGLVERQHARLGERVVHQAPAAELPGGVVVHRLLPERLRHALGDAPV